jgi:hypothetical protein
MVEGAVESDIREADGRVVSPVAIIVRYSYNGAVTKRKR